MAELPEHYEQRKQEARKLIDDDSEWEATRIASRRLVLPDATTIEIVNYGSGYQAIINFCGRHKYYEYYEYSKPPLRTEEEAKDYAWKFYEDCLAEQARSENEKEDDTSAEMGL